MVAACSHKRIVARIPEKWGGATFLITINSGESGDMPPEFFLVSSYALRQLLVQSEAKFLIELLNICGDRSTLITRTVQI